MIIISCFSFKYKKRIITIIIDRIYKIKYQQRLESKINKFHAWFPIFNIYI